MLALTEIPMSESTPVVEPWLEAMLIDEDIDLDVDDLTQIQLKEGPVYVGHYVSHTPTHLTLKLYGTAAEVAFERSKLAYVLMCDDDTGFMVEIDLLDEPAVAGAPNLRSESAAVPLTSLGVRRNLAGPRLASLGGPKLGGQAAARDVKNSMVRSMEETMSEYAIELAEKAMKKVEGYVREGLPACYSSFNAFLNDFYPDLPWDDRLGVSIRHILESGRFEVILDGVQQRFGWDFRAELRAAMFSQEEGPILRLRAEPLVVDDHCPECGEFESECVCGFD